MARSELLHVDTVNVRKSLKIITTVSWNFISVSLSANVL